MKPFSPSLILFAGFLIASCEGPAEITVTEDEVSETEVSENNETNPTQEATSEHNVHGYWENSDLDYVSTSWPIDEANADDTLINIFDMPLLEEAFIDTAPAGRNDGIAVGELGVDGGDKEMIVKLAQEMSDNEHGDYDSLLIIHKDKLLFESYYKWGRVNVTHPQASATKTYTGLALGRAIQLGYLTMEDLDRPVISFFNDLDPTKFIEGAERVTLHHALTMRTGIRISDEQNEEFNNNPDQVKGQKLVQAIFEQSEPITEESQSAFAYGNYATPLVMQVIDTVVPGGAEEFLKNELLSKMGVSTYEWRTGLGGIPAAGWKSSFSSRAMAKFGSLAINNGKWNGEQLISEAFIAKAINRNVSLGEDDIFFTDAGSVSNPGYGYFWWLADLKSGDKTYSSFSAQGGSGQYIIVIEELDLVVVMTGAHRGDGKNLPITAEGILPAFVE